MEIQKNLEIKKKKKKKFKGLGARFMIDFKL